MPTNHLGLWDDKSLSKLVKFYPLKKLEILYEPIQDYHFEFFKETAYL